MSEPSNPVPPANVPPPPCDQEVFKNGHGICCVDARMHEMEAWVKKVRERSGQRVDWHYSGGIANVLYLGSYSEVMKAIMALEPELDGQIMRLYTEGSHGLYRAGDIVPEDTIAIDNSSGFSTPIIGNFTSPDAEAREKKIEENVKASTRLRVEFAEKQHPCPCCGTPGLSVCGGIGSFWLECGACSSYSALSKTCEEALSNVEGWQVVDPALNARMHPPIGG